MPAVVPVTDYEPPVFGGPPILPPVNAFRCLPPVPAAAVAGPSEPDRRAAAVFADAALRRVLEVIDRRRPLAQLRPLLSAGLVDSLLAGTARAVPANGTARLRRVVAQMSTTDGRCAEVAAAYTRGNRLHAIAARVEQISTATGPRWQVVALHLG
ncbi:MAG: Rv3235 family protein [Mycobacterium sp.]|nr:Rv3235 family protein [Mycobacterium sp.]